MKSDRIIGLDIIRAIAITIVVIFHSTPILSPLSTIPVAGFYIHKLLALTEPFGILGVELFFVLSGFLIGSILIKIFVRSGKYGFSEIRSFLVRRWFRTLPNYWLILIANIILYTSLGKWNFSIEDVRYFFFVQNLWYKHPAFYPEAWSLAIEEWFYLTLPFILLIISYTLRKSSQQRKILMAFIFYALIFFVLRVSLIDNTNTDPMYFDYGIRKVVLFRLDAISYGLFIAYLNIYYHEPLMKVKRSLLMISIAGIVLITAIHYIGVHPYFKLYNKNGYYRFFHNVFILTLIPLFFSLSIPYASALKEIKNKAFSAIVTTISKISYSMYLVHFTLIFLPFWQLVKYTKYNCVPIYILYWAIVIGVSLVLYNFFELPVMNIRKKISKEDPKV